MKSIRIATLSLALGLGLGMGVAAPASAQSIGYNLRTGDVWLDQRIGEVNDYGTRYREPFISELNRNYGAPRSLLEDLLQRRGWSPGDVYYACAMARSLNVPCSDIVRDYERHRADGQGWGALAQSRGIKPGSAAFHAMKRGTVATYDRWGNPITLGTTSRVDWSKGKKASAGKGMGKGKPVAGAPERMKSADHRAGSHHGSIDHGKAKGNSGHKDKGGKDKGGKGNGKGNGKG